MRKISLILALLALSAAASFAQVSVTATAGVLGPAPYPNLGQAFQAINGGVHQGSITIDIVASTNEGSNPATLNSAGAAPATYTSVLIRPRGDDIAIVGTPPSGIGVVQLNGADNVTIDGDNPDTAGTNRNLRIVNNAVDTTTFSSVIRIALNQTTVPSADNVSIKNLFLLGNARGRNVAAATSTTGSENNTYGILAGGGASTSAPTAPPDPITSLTTLTGTNSTAANLTIQNNVINTAARAIAVQGAAASVFPGLLIENNTIGSATLGLQDQVYSIGVTVQGSTNAIVRRNTVYVESFVATGIRGLECGSISPSINGALFDSNQVLRVRNNNVQTFGAYGINLDGGNNHGIRNNFISDINHDMTGGLAFSTQFGVFGIRIATGTGHQVYNNSVNLHGLMTGTATSSLLSAAFALVSTSSTGCDVRNNIFANNITGGTTSVAHVSVYLPSGGTTAMNLTENKNSYYSGTDGARQGVGQAGTSAGTNFFVTLAALATYSSTLSPAGTNDNASIASTGAVPFASTDDLHITAAAPEFDTGVTIASVTTDIDGETRPQGAAYDIGADETPALPSFSIDNVTANEGNVGTTTNFVFTVTKTGAAPANTSVQFTTQDGTATLANNDYQFNAGTLTFTPADTTMQITVVVNGDNTVEPNETFTVHLFNPFNATIGTADGTGTIVNDDAAPTPTATPTATATATPTPTPTPTATATATPPSTPTPTPIPGTLLDTITGADTTTFTGSTPRTYMGNSWTNNTIPAGSTSVRITALTLYMVSATTQAYTDVVARIQFWNNANTAATPVFTNASGALITVDLGPQNLTANTFTAIPVTLGTPLILPGGPGTNWGFAQNFQGNTGAGLGDTTNLTSLITAHSNGLYSTGQITTGTAPAFGYYRNASNRVDFNFDSTDARTLAGLNAQGIGIVVFGTAQAGTPTPTPTATATATATVTATATATATPSTTATATATPTPTPRAAQALNLSTRMRVQVGDKVGIGGFIITGASKRVIVRAIGPSLSHNGITDPLADPILELHGPSGFTTVINDNWRDTQEAAILATGLAPTNDLESAIDATLAPGAYTAVVRGKNNTSGVALVEVYDLNPTSGKLGNISTRAFVDTGDNIVIAGFVLGNNGGDDKIVVRGIGPSFAPCIFPASAVLADPNLELRDENGTLLVSNNDWQDNPVQAAEIAAAGLAPTDPREAAIAATLRPGFYTVLFFGTSNGRGIGAVEVYDLGDGTGPSVPSQAQPCVPSPTPTPSPTPVATPTATPSPTAAPGPCIENFDGVTAPNLPAGWVATNAAGSGALWATTPTTPDSPPNDAVVKDSPDISDKRLDSRGIAVSSPSAVLHFRNNYNLQDSFDGGVLEVSINGGPFTDILAAGGSFVAGGYTSTIGNGFGSPIAGRAAWSGNSGGYIDTAANLGPNVNGQTIRLRFRLGTDQAVGVSGWRVDTISIVGGSCP